MSGFRRGMGGFQGAGGQPNPKLFRLGAIALAIIVAIGLLLALNPFRTIQSGTVGLKLDFGSVQPEALPPGLHFAIPLYQTIVTVSTQPQTVTSDETAATHDLQTVQTRIAVTFRVDPEEAAFFWQNFRSFDTLGQRVIAPAISNDVKAITARYDAEELVTERDKVDAEIKALIITSLSPYHLTVEAVNVANFAFSNSYEQAIEQKQVAQQQALQAQYTLQQTEISAQQQVVQAKAAADAAVASASGNAKATVLQAEAEAKANALVSQSLTPQILEMRAISRWNGALPTYLSGNAPLPFIGGIIKAPAATPAPPAGAP